VPSQSAKVLLFDLGGVLVQNAAFERLGALLAEPTDLPTLKGRWLSSPSVRAFELGRIGPGAFAEAFIAEWSPTCSAEAFIVEFADWPGDFYPSAIPLLACLRRRHRIACLSNSNELHWNRFDGFRACFDEAFSSHLIGAIKPDAACFRLVLERLRLAPGDVVFFDDIEANARAAAKLGINAIHVDGFEALVLALEREQLLDS
jgi:epoxide hydrolase-like predicted phosphatase